MTSGLEYHPLANIFPLIEGKDFDELVADIEATGLREKIVIHDGMILDGRNRYRAAIAAGVVEPGSYRWPDGGGCLPAFRLFVPKFDGESPLAFVISHNLRRRHLDESQRAMVAAKIANMRQGERTDLSPIGEKSVSQERAAELLNVGKRTVERAAEIVERGTTELAEAVTRGEVSVSAAAEIVKALPLDQQRALVLEVAKSPDTKRAFAGAVKELRAEKQEEKRERRGDREKVLGETLAPTGTFGLIVEDYEWDYEVWSRQTGMDRHAANHYPVSDDAHAAEEIVARTKDRLAVAADDCLLAMWSTVPHLAIAIDVLRLRGFRYVSHYAWGKDRAGTGHWNRNKHEILLLGVKGNIPCPSPGTQWDSLIMAPVGEHSRKPDAFLEMLEAYFPTLPKIELNARKARQGWKAWGLEAPHDPETGEILDPPPEALNGGNPHSPDANSISASPRPDAGEAAPELSTASLGEGAASTSPAEIEDIPNFLKVGDPENAWRAASGSRGHLTDAQRSALAVAFAPSSHNGDKPCP